MKHFKVRVQYTNGIEFIHECKALTNWQAAAIARVEGRRLGLGGAMDVKETEAIEKGLVIEGVTLESGESLETKICQKY